MKEITNVEVARIEINGCGLEFINHVTLVEAGQIIEFIAVSRDTKTKKSAPLTTPTK